MADAEGKEGKTIAEGKGDKTIVPKDGLSAGEAFSLDEEMLVEG